MTLTDTPTATDNPTPKMTPSANQRDGDGAIATTQQGVVQWDEYLEGIRTVLRWDPRDSDNSLRPALAASFSAMERTFRLGQASPDLVAALLLTVFLPRLECAPHLFTLGSDVTRDLLDAEVRAGTVTLSDKERALVGAASARLGVSALEVAMLWRGFVFDALNDERRVTEDAAQVVASLGAQSQERLLDQLTHFYYRESLAGLGLLHAIVLVAVTEEAAAEEEGDVAAAAPSADPTNDDDDDDEVFVHRPHAYAGLARTVFAHLKETSIATLGVGLINQFLSLETTAVPYALAVRRTDSVHWVKFVLKQRLALLNLFYLLFHDQALLVMEGGEAVEYLERMSATHFGVTAAHRHLYDAECHDLADQAAFAAVLLWTRWLYLDDLAEDARPSPHSDTTPKLYQSHAALVRAGTWMRKLVAVAKHRAVHLLAWTWALFVKQLFRRFPELVEQYADVAAEEVTQVTDGRAERIQFVTLCDETPLTTTLLADLARFTQQSELVQDGAGRVSYNSAYFRLRLLELLDASRVQVAATRDALLPGQTSEWLERWQTKDVDNQLRAIVVPLLSLYDDRRLSHTTAPADTMHLSMDNIHPYHSMVVRALRCEVAPQARKLLEWMADGWPHDNSHFLTFLARLLRLTPNPAALEQLVTRFNAMHGFTARAAAPSLHAVDLSGRVTSRADLDTDLGVVVPANTHGTVVQHAGKTPVVRWDLAYKGWQCVRELLRQSADRGAVLGPYESASTPSDEQLSQLQRMRDAVVLLRSLLTAPHLTERLLTHTVHGLMGVPRGDSLSKHLCEVMRLVSGTAVAPVQLDLLAEVMRTLAYARRWLAEDLWEHLRWHGIGIGQSGGAMVHSLAVPSRSITLDAAQLKRILTKIEQPQGRYPVTLALLDLVHAAVVYRQQPQVAYTVRRAETDYGEPLQAADDPFAGVRGRCLREWLAYLQNELLPRFSTWRYADLADRAALGTGIAATLAAVVDWPASELDEELRQVRGMVVNDLVFQAQPFQVQALTGMVTERLVELRALTERGVTGEQAATERMVLSALLLLRKLLETRARMSQTTSPLEEALLKLDTVNSHAGLFPVPPAGGTVSFVTYLVQYLVYYGHGDLRLAVVDLLQRLVQCRSPALPSWKHLLGPKRQAFGSALAILTGATKEDNPWPDHQHWLLQLIASVLAHQPDYGVELLRGDPAVEDYVKTSPDEWPFPDMKDSSVLRPVLHLLASTTTLRLLQSFPHLLCAVLRILATLWEVPAYAAHVRALESCEPFYNQLHEILLAQSGDAADVDMYNMSHLALSSLIGHRSEAAAQCYRRRIPAHIYGLVGMEVVRCAHTLGPATTLTVDRLPKGVRLLVTRGALSAAHFIAVTDTTAAFRFYREDDIRFIPVPSAPTRDAYATFKVLDTAKMDHASEVTARYGPAFAYDLDAVIRYRGAWLHRQEGYPDDTDAQRLARIGVLWSRAESSLFHLRETGRLLRVLSAVFGPAFWMRGLRSSTDDNAPLDDPFAELLDSLAQQLASETRHGLPMDYKRAYLAELIAHLAGCVADWGELRDRQQDVQVLIRILGSLRTAYRAVTEHPGLTASSTVSTTVKLQLEQTVGWLGMALHSVFPWLRRGYGYAADSRDKLSPQCYLEQASAEGNVLRGICLDVTPTVVHHLRAALDAPGDKPVVRVAPLLAVLLEVGKFVSGVPRKWVHLLKETRAVTVLMSWLVRGLASDVHDPKLALAVLQAVQAMSVSEDVAHHFIGQGLIHYLCDHRFAGALRRGTLTHDDRDGDMTLWCKMLDVVRDLVGTIRDPDQPAAERAELCRSLNEFFVAYWPQMETAMRAADTLPLLSDRVTPAQLLQVKELHAVTGLFLAGYVSPMQGISIASLATLKPAFHSLLGPVLAAAVRSVDVDDVDELTLRAMKRDARHLVQSTRMLAESLVRIALTALRHATDAAVVRHAGTDAAALERAEERAAQGAPSDEVRDAAPVDFGLRPTVPFTASLDAATLSFGTLIRAMHIGVRAVPKTPPAVQDAGGLGVATETAELAMVSLCAQLAHFLLYDAPHRVRTDTGTGTGTGMEEEDRTTTTAQLTLALMQQVVPKGTAADRQLHRDVTTRAWDVLDDYLARLRAYDDDAYVAQLRDLYDVDVASSRDLLKTVRYFLRWMLRASQQATETSSLY